MSTLLTNLLCALVSAYVTYLLARRLLADKVARLERQLDAAQRDNARLREELAGARGNAHDLERLRDAAAPLEDLVARLIGELDMAVEHGSDLVSILIQFIADIRGHVNRLLPLLPQDQAARLESLCLAATDLDQYSDQPGEAEQARDHARDLQRYLASLTR